MTDQEKLQFLVDRLEGGNMRKFAEKTQIDTSILSKIRNGVIGMRKRYSNILEAYPMISREWLENGVGYCGDLSIEVTREHYVKLLEERDKMIATLTKEIELQQTIIERFLNEKEG